ncbi:GNAT family N-acetyltransferase [Albidovulum sediminicola]|uniref:GNAT family N-acetyltransferase n=1 Tax=Albidovulum sediminicola TaxID=2984331 RepID=A0ABT2Z5T1_9RHOB|nr:GNAT family N-acetyltransferase [Defluviimonas sp. WL0075]MCV2866484.1 GNAT family N-acetyltransferase [Defluviimonas sp. WL0075]
MTIRPAGPEDHSAILGLWNSFIRDTTVTFTSEEKTEAGLAALIDERRAAGREFLVAEAGGTFAGFATYAQFRGGNGYAHAMEHSIMLSPAVRGQGFGRQLMAAVEDHARAGGAHTLFAGVSGENPEGQAFHARLGFRTVARIPEVGRKFDRWLDLVLMMKLL